MKDEIVSGIKNALERGSTVEDAAQSFINAGYNPLEVREAASTFTSGATAITNPLQPYTPLNKIQLDNPNSPVPSPALGKPQLPAIIGRQTEKSHSWTWVWVVILGLVLLGLIGAIAYLLFYGPNKIL